MAKKKKENTLSYLQMPLPEGGKYSKMTKVAFGGINKRYTLDSGELSMESNISTKEYPYLTPSERKKSILNQYSEPISMFAFDDFILVIYKVFEGEIKIKIDYITYDEETDKYEVYTGLLQDGDNVHNEEYFAQRSIVQFNVYIQSDDIVNGSYKKHLLIFPDKKSMFFDKADLLEDENNDTGDDFKLYDMSVDIKEYYNDTPEVDESGAIIYPPSDTSSHNGWYRNTADLGTSTYDIYHWTTYEVARHEDEIGLEEVENEDGTTTLKPTGFTLDETGNYIFDGETTEGWKVSFPPVMPNIKYATVHLSRLFGVSDDCVFASGFNDYTNWNLDTPSEYNESNAWQSKAQSNTKADGNFTGITTFQGHIVCFKRDYMHEIYNTKNPFRIQDIYAEGAIDNRTIQDVDGKLIFVSEDDVKVYTGSNPRIIGYNLNMPRYEYAVSGTDNRNYYLYCEDEIDGKGHLYVYDTFTDLWSEQSIDSKVLSFAHNKNGMYMLCYDGYVYKMDTDEYDHSWSFETDLITSQTVNIKHIKKLQMLAEIAEKANLKVYILYDNEVFDENSSHLVYQSKKYGRLPIRVKPRKTANYGFKLHFEGAGYVKLYELEIFTEAGGDLYV
jgi:hypothetical protein